MKTPLRAAALPPLPENDAAQRSTQCSILIYEFVEDARAASHVDDALNRLAALGELLSHHPGYRSEAHVFSSFDWLGDLTDRLRVEAEHLAAEPAELSTAPGAGELLWPIATSHPARVELLSSLATAHPAEVGPSASRTFAPPDGLASLASHS